MVRFIGVPTLMLGLLCFFSTFQALANSSVAELYIELRQSGSAPDLDYPLELQGSGWFSRNLSWDTDIPALVDTHSGYIFISDEGTGGGSFSTQVALWRLRDGSPLIGIAETSYLAANPEETRLRFFTRFTGHWREETSIFWPDVSPADFMPQDMSIADLKVLEEIGAVVFVSLPQKGLNPVAWLSLRAREIRSVCDGEDWFVVTDPVPYRYFCDKLAPRMMNRIELIWQKADERFTVGPKSRSLEPWESR